MTENHETVLKNHLKNHMTEDYREPQVVSPAVFGYAPMAPGSGAAGGSFCPHLTNWLDTPGARGRRTWR